MTGTLAFTAIGSLAMNPWSTPEFSDKCSSRTGGIEAPTGGVRWSAWLCRSF